MIVTQFIFLRYCAIHKRQFQIPLFFCILFSTLLNKADLILVTQSKPFFESNYFQSTDEKSQLLVVSSASKIFGTLFACCS